MMYGEPQTRLGASPVSPLPPPPGRGPPAIPARTLDTSDTAANRPSKRVNVVSTETGTLVGASRSLCHGAEHDGRTVERVAAVYHAPPRPSSSQPHAQPITPQRPDDQEEYNRVLRFWDSDGGLSDDDMSMDSEESFDSAVSGDIEMTSGLETSPMLGSGKGKGGHDRNALASRPTMFGGEVGARSGPWSASEWRALTLEGPTRASPSAFVESSWKKQDTLPRASSSAFLESSWKTQDTLPRTSSSAFLENPWTSQNTLTKSNNHSYQRRQTPRLCIVCKLKPPYSKNGKTYPTCGLKCAAELEKQKERGAWESGRVSSDPGSCVICHTRPKHVSASSGRVYPTCGLRCAAKYDPAKYSAEMCTVCKKRPKLATGTGKFYDQCSMACRGKAEAVLENADIVTCNSCLACWTEPALSDRPFCSDYCKEAIIRCAPALIEMPRGHFLYEKYHKQFHTGWETTSQRKVVVQHMYFFAQAPAVAGRYEIYRAALERSSRRRSPAETEGWVAVTRECNVGDTGSVTICSSPTCHFCNIMLNSFTRDDYLQVQAVPVALTAAKASEALRDSQPGSTKALLFVRVIHGPSQARLQKCTETQLLEPQRVRDDVVAVISSQRRTQIGLCVYNPDALVLLGLVVYSEK